MIFKLPTREEAAVLKARRDALPKRWWDCCICGKAMHCPERCGSMCLWCGVWQIHYRHTITWTDEEITRA